MSIATNVGSTDSLGTKRGNVLATKRGNVLATNVGSTERLSYKTFNLQLIDFSSLEIPELC